MLKFALLSYPAILYDDSPVTDFISQKALVLLCYLAIENRPHSREVLAGLFWSEMTQERALSNLRQALHNIQKLVPGYIITTRQVVQFDTSQPHQLDIEQDLITAYHDGFMAGIHFPNAEELDVWLTHKREYYSRIYSQLLEERLASAKDWGTIEVTAHRIIKNDPYHEVAHCALWRALVSRGNRTGAIQSAQTLQNRLMEDLGIEPNPATTQIIQRLSLGTHAHLPPVASAFVGRKAAIEHIRGLLHKQECRLITLVGMGGIGKSRLVSEIACLDARDYLNGVCYIPLAPLSDTNYLYALLATALDLKLDPAEVKHYLKAREMLLVFDNAEHLSDFPLWLADLMQAAPDIKILVSSRHQLNLREEWVFHIPGMQDDGLELLRQCVARHGENFPSDDGAAALCDLLEGLPLAIELAGAMLAHHTASSLINAIHASLDSLQSQWRNADSRHQSLRAIFLTSWQLLTAEEQTALANLSVFQGTFTQEASKTVAQVTLSTLDSLHTKSLIRRYEQNYDLHPMIAYYAREFQQHPADLIRRLEVHCLAVLQDADVIFAKRDVMQAVEQIRQEIDSIRQCWQQKNQDLLRQMSFTLHRFYEGIGWYAEGLTIFSHTQGITDRTLRGQLLAHQTGMLLRLGQGQEALHKAQESVGLLSSDEGEKLAFALNLLGIAQLYSGDMPHASRTLTHCAEIYRSLEMVELLKPLVNLGAIYVRTGETDLASSALEEAHTIAQKIGDQVGEYHITNMLGITYSLQESYETAKHYYLQALDLSHKTGFQQGQAITLNNLGDVETLLGNPQQGYDYAEQAITLAEALQDQRSLTYGLVTKALAQIALTQSSAKATLLQALQTAMQAQAEPLLAAVLYAVGEWHMMLNREADAQQIWAVISQHPATEMDYKRRALKWLDGATSPHGSLHELATHALNLLS